MGSLASGIASPTNHLESRDLAYHLGGVSMVEVRDHLRIASDLCRSIWSAETPNDMFVTIGLQKGHDRLSAVVAVFECLKPA